MKQVLVRPSFSDWEKGRLFSHGTSFSGVYKEAFRRWRSDCIAYDINVSTWDTNRIEDADLFWFLDLPASRNEFNNICRQLRPETPIVLQVLESPAIAPQNLCRSSLYGISSVLTYEDPAPEIAGVKVYQYRLPVEKKGQQPYVDFNRRRGLLMLATNRVAGIWAVRQPGLAGLPGIGLLLSGWQCTPRLTAEILRSDLYRLRRKIARCAERVCPEFLDIYGRGWNCEPISWFGGYNRVPYRCWRGHTCNEKEELCSRYRFTVAFENFRGSRGYISEKIFEPMLAGSVPVYLGDENIARYVPKEAFVDARLYPRMSDLLDYLIHMPEKEWSKKLYAGRSFVASQDFAQFEPAAAARTFLDVVTSTLNVKTV